MRRRLFAPLIALALSAPLVVACGSTTPKPPDVSMEAVGNYKFNPTSYTAKSGTVRIALKNIDQMSHSVVVTDANGTRVNTFRILVAGGHEGSGTTKLAAGSYKLVCDVPGHAARGQIADLVVS